MAETPQKPPKEPPVDIRTLAILLDKINDGIDQQRRSNFIAGGIMIGGAILWSVLSLGKPEGIHLLACGLLFWFGLATFFRGI